jgi:hypothetical protein
LAVALEVLALTALGLLIALIELLTALGLESFVLLLFLIVVPGK